jgi:hypothetical protein
VDSDTTEADLERAARRAHERIDQLYDEARQALGLR